MKTLNHCSLLVIFLLNAIAFGAESDPSFSIQSSKKAITFSRSELMKRPDLTTIEVESDPAYNNGKKTSYQAVPLLPLFDSIGVPADSTIQFHCLDGFSAPLDGELLLNRNPKFSMPYLAIEPKGAKWPPLKPGNAATPGPFYIIWSNPKASGIGQEQWPYQLSSLEVKPSLRETFPAIFPEKALAASHPVNLGFKVFQKNCFSCHTLNLQGESKMGPDLNVPMNISEYLTLAAIRLQIRDPQKLRTWPEAKMKGFSKEALSDADIEKLLAYIKYMAKKKVALLVK